MTASCTEKGSGRRVSVERPHTHTYADTYSHYLTQDTRLHLVYTQKRADKFSSRSHRHWQTKLRAHVHSQIQSWYTDAGFIHLWMYMQRHTHSCGHSREGTLGKVGSNLIWPWQHRGREGGLMGGRDGLSIRNEVMVWARCLLQILERNGMTLNWCR